MPQPRKSRGPAKPRSAGNSGRLLPEVSPELIQSAEAEVSVLGAMILNNETIDVVAPILNVESFASAAHRKIYEAILSLHQHSHAVDLVTLNDELESELDAALHRAAAERGFTPEHHRLDLMGRCKDCN